jgi:hypothetical protein
MITGVGHCLGYQLGAHQQPLLQLADGGERTACASRLLCTLYGSQADFMGPYPYPLAASTTTQHEPRATLAPRSVLKLATVNGRGSPISTAARPPPFDREAGNPRRSDGVAVDIPGTNAGKTFVGEPPDQFTRAGWLHSHNSFSGHPPRRAKD